MDKMEQAILVESEDEDRVKRRFFLWLDAKVQEYKKNAKESPQLYTRNSINLTEYEKRRLNLEDIAWTELEDWTATKYKAVLIHEEENGCCCFPPIDRMFLEIFIV
jgi:hypothetical protein